MRRLLAAALVVGALLLFVAHAPTRASAAPDGPGVDLLFQTPWLQGQGPYSFHLGLAGVSPADRLQVTVYDQIRTRTDFDNAAQGQVNSAYFYRQPVPVSGLQADPSGGFDIALPVNQPAPPGEPFATVDIGETGVFAMQFALFDPSGSPLGKPLTTFLVFAQHTASQGDIKPLSAALVVPVASKPVVGPSGTLGTPDQAETSRLEGLAAVLNKDSSVPASILASPVTLDEVAAGGSALDRQTMVELNGATAGGPFEILPTSYSPVTLGDVQSEIPDEVDPQLNSAATTLNSVFGLAPATGTWVVDGPLDGATLGVLIAHHARQVIVPDGDLTALPNVIDTTFARSTDLAYAGSTLHVVGADPTLTADFTRSEPPVLAANHLLAELAMVYTETPSVTRGVAVMPPQGWAASATFVDTLLTGLRGDPLVAAVTASSLFSAVAPAQGTRYLSSGGTAATAYGPAVADQIAGARNEINDLAQVLPSQSSQLQGLEHQLLLAESPTLTAAERQSVLTAISRSTGYARHAVSLPPATSITLTSTRGQVPLTVLAAPGVHPRVQLELRSQRLIFRPFQPHEGTCTVVTESREVCLLTLTNQNTTLHVPVETRSSGVFPLDVFLYVPGSPTELAHDQDTVRSTAVSSVAVILIVAAGVALVLWWGRDLRRGRRPKGMVPSPVADSATLGDPRITVGDPRVDGFFERSPPDAQQNGAAMSPSGAGAGPSPTTDNYGPGRETREQ